MSGEQLIANNDFENPHHHFDISKYTSIEEANTTLNDSRHSGQLSILYVNIVSLYQNISELTTVNFGYNGPGYNKLRIIRTFFCGPFRTPITSIQKSSVITNSVITNFGYNELFFAVPPAILHRL